jgi:SNF2 family DNA or RNA helicase
MSYGQFRRLLNQEQEQEAFEYYLVDPGPDVVILDEAHQIKNAQSQIARLVQSFDTQTRICLTGYPLQNNVKEYYYMLNFIAPGILGSPEAFTANFGSWVDKVYADTTRASQDKARKRMYALQLITSRVTHRMDQTILQHELPLKTEISVLFKLSPPQRLGYVRLVNELLSESYSPLLGLQVLRGVCNHPKIFQAVKYKGVLYKVAIALT